MSSYHLPSLSLIAVLPSSMARAARRPVVDRRRRDGRADAGARARGARGAVGRARRGRHGQHRQPLDLPGQAQPRSLGPLRHRRSAWSTRASPGSRARSICGDQAIYRFNLQPEPGHKFPAFVNLQQYYVEEYLYERCLAEPAIEMRFRNKVVSVTPQADFVVGRGRDAGRPLHARSPLAGRLRRRAQPRPSHARPAVRGRGLPRPVPDRRHPPARRPAQGARWVSVL